MKPISFFLCAAWVLSCAMWSDDFRPRFIEQYAPIAQAEFQRAGVPVSIKLGQAILESNAGTSVLSIQANNMFGIKCSGNWAATCFEKEDDDYDAQRNLIKSQFRVYENPEQSFVDHSEFLRKERYAFLFSIPATDYKAWAVGLQTAGYATSKTYAADLIGIIEKYKLYEYDQHLANRPHGVTTYETSISAAPQPVLESVANTYEEAIISTTSTEPTTQKSSLRVNRLVFGVPITRATAPIETTSYAQRNYQPKVVRRSYATPGH